MGNTCTNSCGQSEKEQEIRVENNEVPTRDYSEAAKASIIKLQSHVRGHQTRKNLKSSHLDLDNLVKDDQLEVTSEQIDEAGSVYSGQIKKGTYVRQGYGELTKPCGSRYHGLWENDKQSGFGRVVHFDGDVYDGAWLEGKATGFGIYRCNDGVTKYEGFWLDDEWDSFGIHHRADGQIYKGQMKKGQMDGFGQFIFTDQSTYIGEYRENEMNGFGITVQTNNSKFAGNWQNSVKNGIGTYVWSDSRAYHGEYDANQKHGEGVYFFDDGRSYVGGWSEGQQHGLGYTVFPNMKIIKQNFENGKRKERLQATDYEKEVVKTRIEDAKNAIQDVKTQIEEAENKINELTDDFELRKSNQNQTQLPSNDLMNSQIDPKTEKKETETTILDKSSHILHERTDEIHFSRKSDLSDPLIVVDSINTIKSDVRFFESPEKVPTQQPHKKATPRELTEISVINNSASSHYSNKENQAE